MKTLLLLLLTCLPLCAATTYPMLSDTTNRTVTGGTTNLAFLNGTNVFTGTNTFSGVVIATNTGSVFAGDGSGITGMGQFRSRILFRTNNMFFPTLGTGPTGATDGTFTPTNYAYYMGTLSTNIMNITLPALMSTNSKVGGMFISERTNAIAANVFMDFTVGTNLVMATSSVGSTTTLRVISAYNVPYGFEIFRNYGSKSIQLATPPPASLTGAQTVFYNAASYVDTSAPWELKIGLIPNTTATYTTNIFLREFLLVEQWIVE